MQTAIVWFRNDLRLDDNLTLTEALAHNDWVIPIYIFDKRHYRLSTYGFPKIGAHRAQFIIECVQQLRQELTLLGSNLMVRQGIASIVITELCKEYGVSSVYFSKEVAPEETKEEAELIEALHEHGVNCFALHNSLLINHHRLPFSLSAMPDVFSQFRIQVEKQNIVDSPLQKPTIIKTPLGIPQGEIPNLPPFTGPQINVPNPTMCCKGGELTAHRRLQDYVWQHDGPANYFETRNQLTGNYFSTKLSPWLAQGALSAKRLFAEVKAYEAARVANKSTYWIGFELLWRDFFRLTMEKYSANLFFIRGPKRREISYDSNPEKFWAWVNGQTQNHFINACMNELRYTGYLSNRGRQVCASYLVHDLNSNWLMGAAYFESALIDYDVCSNYGNWAYIAGVGNDPRENRIFNVDKQAATYDPHGHYRSLWAHATHLPLTHAI